MRWIKDEDFIRGTVPMTKFEVRLATIGFLGIEKEDVFVDIGAGTGSVSIEAAAQGANVYSIEREDEGISLIKQNARKFGLNINIIQSNAPYGIEGIGGFNKCFIGGSGGNMKDIFMAIDSKIKKGGIVAANFVTLNNLEAFKKLLKENNYNNIAVKLIQVSNIDKNTGIMRAQNPVFLAGGIKS